MSHDSHTFSSCCSHLSDLFFFFFNHTPPTEIYTLSLHDALPISDGRGRRQCSSEQAGPTCPCARMAGQSAPGLADRKSTRLNSSHRCISYAVFCLKKKKKNIMKRTTYIIMTTVDTHLC